MAPQLPAAAAAAIAFAKDRGRGVPTIQSATTGWWLDNFCPTAKHGNFRMNRPRNRWHVLHSVQPRRQSWGYSINQLTGRATFYFRVSKAGNKLALTVVSCCSCTVTVARPTATFGTKTPVASRVVWTHQQVKGGGSGLWLRHVRGLSRWKEVAHRRSFGDSIHTTVKASSTASSLRGWCSLCIQECVLQGFLAVRRINDGHV